MTLTKKEACKLLGISPRTLERRIASGRYTFTRTGDGQYAELSFTHADIGLPEPVPVVEPAPAAPEPTEPIVTCVLSTMELPKEHADSEFAELYKRGEATDSAGNKYDGTNERWPTKGIQSLLGPVEPKPKVTAHVTTMEKLGTPMIGTDGEPVLHAGSDNHPYFGAHNRACGTSSKPRHPNQTRQELLNAIWSDIRRGYSR